MDYQLYRPEWLTLCVRLFMEVFSLPPWNDRWPSEEKAQAYLEDIIRTPGFLGFTVFDHDQLLGVSFGQINQWWQGDEYYLRDFFIHPEYQNQGLGTGFLNYIKAELSRREIHKIVLLTARQSPAENFYSKNGFYTSPNMIMMSWRP